LFVERKVWDEASGQDALRFHFGAWGWCRVAFRKDDEVK
jgi:hypothetical protein